MSVTLVSRIMLNIQNPSLFGNVTVASTTAGDMRSRPQMSHSAEGGRAYPGPFVTSPVDSGLEFDSQSTIGQDALNHDGPRRPGRNKRVWYELDADWAGVRDGERDRGVDDGVEVSGGELVVILGCNANRLFAVKRPQLVIAQAKQ